MSVRPGPRFVKRSKIPAKTDLHPQKAPNSEPPAAMDFADLASFESFWGQLGDDDAFGAIQRREFELAIEGSFEQALLHAADADDGGEWSRRSVDP